MKKFFLICAALAGALCLVFALAGCELFGSGGSAHTHTLTHVSAQAATCTAEGNEEYWYCSECGKYFTDEEAENETTLSALTVAASGHTDSDGDGSCDECGYDMDSKTDPPATHTHTLTHVLAKEATCTEGGNLEYWYCSECGKYFTDEEAENETTLSVLTVAKVVHTLAYTEAVEATCTQDGSEEYWYCSECGKYFTDEEAENETTLSAITVAAHHTLTHTEAQAATCTKEGMEEYWVCSVCEKYFSDEAATTETTLAELTISKIPHNYVDGYCTVGGERAPSEGLALTLSDDETYYTVTGIGECTDTDVVIPSEYEGLPVTAIGAQAFYNNTDLTSITIPESVTSIGSSAFYNCTGLREIYYNATECANLSYSNNVFYKAGQSGEGITVTIGANVTSIPAYLFNPYDNSSYAPKIVSVEFEEGSVCTSIGDYAFWNCTGLTSITIPDSVTTINSYAFYGCTGLTGVYISDIAAWCKITFWGSTANPLYYAGNLYLSGEFATELVIPSNVTSINSYAFYGCAGLTSITIPDSVTSIGCLAFSDCMNLESVTIGSGAIGCDAFSSCTSLTSVTIGSGVTSIDSWVFSNCPGLTKIYYNAEECADLSSDNYVFYQAGKNGEGITVTIGATVKSIPAYLFYPYNSSSATKIVSVIFAEGSSCESIGNYAFYNCTRLTSITIPESVTSIGTGAFYNCTSLTKIYYNATEYADLSSTNTFCQAGQSGEGITVYIGANVKSIPARLFYSGVSSYAPKIVSVVFEAGSVCESIGAYAFYYCTGLTGVYITDIAAWCEKPFGSAFRIYTGNWNLYLNGTLLTDLVIPEGVTSIYSDAFYNCTSLESVTIGGSVTSIGDRAFLGCTSLTSITIPGSVTSIGSSAFSYCTSLESITVESGNTVYHGAGNCLIETESKTLILGCKNSVIPTDESVTSIGNFAFDNCTSLTSITIPDSVTSIGSYAFYNCTGLTNITILEGVTSIGGSAFAYCYYLTEINYNATECADLSSYNYIFYQAGQSGEGITVYIGANVTSIPAYLFSSSCVSRVVFEGTSVCTRIGNYAFYSTSLTTVYYGGTVEDWSAITIGSYNTPLTNATLYYYSEEEPTEEGNYWHYVDGEIVVWGDDSED